MFRRLISLLILCFIVISSLLFFAVALSIWLLTVLFDRRLVLLHQFTCFWGSIYLWFVPAWKVRIFNRERFRKGVTYVIVSNHQSQLDVLVAFRLFRHFKWVSKAEVFKVPLVGWNMYLNRYIGLKRGNIESVRKMYSDCEAAIKNNNPVFIFPEGTRSADGIPKKFQNGAFSLAKRTRTAILPIAISGTKDALPKKSLNFHGSHVMELKVLKEIAFKEFENMKIDDLAQMVRSRIINALKAEKAVLSD